MIITCPQCNSRFSLHSQVLAPEGRNVRCSACREVWFELPDLEELAEEENFDGPPIEDIPEGVKPLAEGANVPSVYDQLEEVPEVVSAGNMGRIGGYGAAGFAFLIILGALLAMQSAIASAWPASNAFYQMLGYEPIIPGKGLIFDHLRVEKNNEVISVEGQIINLAKEEKHVPLIEASLRSEKGDILEKWIIEPPESHIKAEETIAFKANYVPHVKDAHDLLLWFTLAKTASAGGGSNQAPAQDAHADQSGGAAHGESQEPADAPPHQEALHPTPGIDPHLPPSPHTDVPADHNSSPGH